MRENDIRPAKLLLEYLRLSAADAQTFFGPDTGFDTRGCPGCGLTRFQPAFQKNGFDLNACEACKTLYVSPVPRSDNLDAFYRDSPSTRYWSNVFFPAVVEARREQIFRPRAEKIRAFLERPGQRVLDVGAGYGLFLEEVRNLDPDVTVRAVEPGTDLADVCRSKNLETFEGFANDAAADPDWNGWADLVTSFEVIEHVVDVGAFIGSLADLTRPGGLILFTGLCGTGFDIEVLGVRSNAVSPPHHLNFISSDGVVALAARTGLQLVDFSTPGELDIDIVCNALAENPDAVKDDKLRECLLSAGSEERQHMQEALVAENRSSHMWVIMRKPEIDEPVR
jgi:SAM-dependent methyltransferase